MKNKKRKYFGIYINDKVPKINDKINTYYKDIEFDFKGKAFILDENKIDIKEEIKNGEKYRKQGKSTIKFINDKKEIYYINIKICKLWIIWLFLFAFLLLTISIAFLNNYKIQNQNQLIEEMVSYDVELEGLKYVFNINYEDENFKSVELTDKVSGKNIIYPGAHGSFYVEISTKKGNKDMFYNMLIKEEINKPKNLKFKIYGKTYNSIKELADSINGEITKNSKKVLKIDWFWDYDSNDDAIDTLNGETNEGYKFLMCMIGTTEGG